MRRHRSRIAGLALPSASHAEAALEQERSWDPGRPCPDRPTSCWRRWARDAGYTRGALYHQFKGKEDLALAVLRWIEETWWPEVAGRAEGQPTAAARLVALARGHAVYCRRDIARGMMTLRIEFSGKDHPVGRTIDGMVKTLVKYCVQLIEAGRKEGSIPPGPPAKEVANAWLGAMEGVVIALAGHAPHDEELVARAAAGILGLEGLPASGGGVQDS